MRSRFKKEKLKIALFGIMGHGKSATGNLIAGRECFIVSNDVQTCTKNIQSYDNGELIVFDTRGLNDKGETDVNSLQEMLLTFKKEKINALFLVFNGQVCRIDEAMKQVIRMTCKCFLGKYIWKQIGIIFTHYGHDEDEQEEVRKRSKNFVREVLKTAEEEYKNICKFQDQNNKICNSCEKITQTLNCFYINAKKKKDGRYDNNTLQEIEKIKHTIKDYPPIDIVQSKFIVKVDILRNQKGDVSNVLRKEIDKGFLAGLKTFGCYALGVGNLLMTPYYLIDGGACKLLGLPFEKNAYINEMGDDLLSMPDKTREIFTEFPDRVNTKIVGCETQYELYDLKLIYWSDGTIDHQMFNVRQKKIFNKYN